MPAALTVTGLTKAYDGVRVVDDVTMTVEAGQLHALLGPNGAGKTTLLRMCLGLITPDSGSIDLLGAGHDLRRVAGFVESPTFWPYLSARKTLQLLADLEGITTDVDELLDRVGLADRARSSVGSFSVGMRQRLGIAAALLRDPELLLLDEPSGGLDVAGVQQLHAILRDLAAQGVAIVFSSHIMAEVDELCDHATVVHRGRIVATGTLDELRARAPDPLLRLRTSDDPLALTLAGGLQPAAGDGLLIRGTPAQADAYVLRLAEHGVAVRELVRVESPLQELFLELTSA